MRKIICCASMILLVPVLIFTVISFQSGWSFSVKYDREIVKTSQSVNLKYAEVNSISRYGALRITWADPLVMRDHNPEGEIDDVKVDWSTAVWQKGYPYLQNDSRNKNPHMKIEEHKAWGFQLISGSHLESVTKGQPNFKLVWRSVTFPYWPLVALWIFISLAFLLKVITRSKLGLCRHCGYDLKDSFETCPECGKPVTF